MRFWSLAALQDSHRFWTPCSYVVDPVVAFVERVLQGAQSGVCCRHASELIDATGVCESRRHQRFRARELTLKLSSVGKHAQITTKWIQITLPFICCRRNNQDLSSHYDDWNRNSLSNQESCRRMQRFAPQHPLPPPYNIAAFKHSSALMALHMLVFVTDACTLRIRLGQLQENNKLVLVEHPEKLNFCHLQPSFVTIPCQREMRGKTKTMCSFIFLCSLLPILFNSIYGCQFISGRKVLFCSFFGACLLTFWFALVGPLSRFDHLGGLGPIALYIMFMLTRFVYEAKAEAC